MESELVWLLAQSGIGVSLASGVTGVLPIANGGTGNTIGQATLGHASSLMGSDLTLATGTWNGIIVATAPTAGTYLLLTSLEAYNANASAATVEYVISPNASTSTGAYKMGVLQIGAGEQESGSIFATATLPAGQSVYLEAYPSAANITVQHAPSGVAMVSLELIRII